MNKLPREKWPIFCVEEQTFVREKDEWREHDIEKIKEFVYSFYDIVYKIYLHNNKTNDEYQTRFMYREIKEKMKKFVKDDEMCNCMAEDVLKYFTMKKDEFLCYLKRQKFRHPLLASIVLTVAYCYVQCGGGFPNGS